MRLRWTKRTTGMLKTKLARESLNRESEAVTATVPDPTQPEGRSNDSNPLSEKLLRCPDGLQQLALLRARETCEIIAS